MTKSIKALLFVFILQFSPHWAAAQNNDSTVSAELGSLVQSIINDQISAFRTGENERAFSFAAPRLRGIFGTSDRFIEMVKGGYAPIYGAQSWNYGRNRLLDSKLYQEVMLVGPSGIDWLALYTFTLQDDGTWKISGVQLKRAPTSST